MPCIYNVPLFPKCSPGLDCVVISDQPGDPGRNAEKGGTHRRGHLECGFSIPILQVGIVRREESEDCQSCPALLCWARLAESPDDQECWEEHLRNA